jgi:non-ribosomal peptide synthetase component E (peptide arylation enzyme)
VKRWGFLLSRSSTWERVAPYKVPKKVVFMDKLPLSAVGKILKRELRVML